MRELAASHEGSDGIEIKLVNYVGLLLLLFIDIIYIAREYDLWHFAICYDLFT